MYMLNFLVGLNQLIILYILYFLPIAKCWAVVVFPTPPFWFVTVIISIYDTSFENLCKMSNLLILSKKC